MPVGPSHRSHNSSSRSSSRSYSSSSRNNSSSSRSYSSSRRSSYSSPRRYYSSTTYYSGDYGSSVSISPKSWAITGIVFGFIFAVVMLILGAILFCSNVAPSILMAKDAKEYYEIIENAENGVQGYYLITISDIRNTGASTSGGNPTLYRFHGSNNSYFEGYTEVRRSGVNYYYLLYEFTDESGRQLNGETYSCYSESALLGLSEITFAYTMEYDADGSWDIIPTNYKLKGNMDYARCNSNVFIGVVFFLAGVGLFVLFIYLSKKVSKMGENNLASQTESNSSQTKARTHVYKVCLYCGSHLPINEGKCSSCGAKNFNVQTETLDD